MFPFNVRVYGLLIIEGQLLVADEVIKGKLYTKLPGGGLEWGEGTRDCLQREFMEELNLPITVGRHMYTTDFFQVSAWNPQHQVISIYYEVLATDLPEALRTANSNNSYTIPSADGNAETFRFVSINEALLDVLTLPIDKVVAKMLVAE